MEGVKENIDYNKELYDMYKGLPVNVYNNVRKELCKELGWSIATFYSRINQRRPIKKLEIPIIVKIFEKYGFKIFT